VSSAREVSFEFFPPRTPAGRDKLRDTWRQLAALKPRYFSVTFGAGGSTREGTLETVLAIRAEAGRALAAAAGALLSPSGAVTPTMGRAPLLLSLVVVIVAGMDSVAAIFLLSIGLGIFGNACAWLLSPQWSYVALLAAVCLLLSARPAGIVVLAGRRD